MDVNPNVLLLQNLYLQTSPPVTVPASDGIKGQMTALRLEVRRMASGMGNIFFRSSFKRCIEIALKELFKSLLPFYASRRFDTVHSTALTVTTASRPGYETILRKTRTNTLNFYLDTKNLFGTVYFRTQWFRVTCHANEPQSPDVGSWEETEVSFILQPAPWVCMKYDFDVTRSSRELRNAIKAYQIIPDDSVVIKLCEAGNLSKLQSLISGGSASIRDVTTNGWSLLHVSNL
jgi:hypothetical protein